MGRTAEQNDRNLHFPQQLGDECWHPWPDLIEPRAGQDYANHPLSYGPLDPLRVGYLFLSRVEARARIEDVRHLADIVRHFQVVMVAELAAPTDWAVEP